MSRDELVNLLKYCHWIPAQRGIGGAERDLVSELNHAGAFKRSQNHFSGLEPKLHLQSAHRQPDGSWLFLFDNGKRKWSLTSGPSVRI